MTCKQESLQDDNGDYLCISEEIRSVTAERESTLQMRSYHQIDGEKTNSHLLSYLVCTASLHDPPGAFMQRSLLGNCVWKFISDNDQLHRRLLSSLSRTFFVKCNSTSLSSDVKNKNLKRCAAEPSKTFPPTRSRPQNIPSESVNDCLRSSSICHRCSNPAHTDCIPSCSYCRAKNAHENKCYETLPRQRKTKLTKDSSHRKRSRRQSSTTGNKLSSISIKFWMLAFAIQQMWVLLDLFFINLFSNTLFPITISLYIHCTVALKDSLDRLEINALSDVGVLDISLDRWCVVSENVEAVKLYSLSHSA